MLLSSSFDMLAALKDAKIAMTEEELDGKLQELQQQVEPKTTSLSFQIRLDPEHVIARTYFSPSFPRNLTLIRVISQAVIACSMLLMSFFLPCTIL